MKRQYKVGLILALCATSLLGAAGCAAMPLGTFDVQRREITYVERPTGPLQLTLFTPTRDGAPVTGRPMLLLFHGGAFRYGHRSQMTPFAEFFARQGFVAASVSYRLTPQAAFPGPVADTVAAIRYFRIHAAELGGDPDRIGLVGMSAGAYLAMFAAFCNPPDAVLGEECGDAAIPTDVRAVVNLYGPSELAHRFDEASLFVKPLVVDFVGKRLEDAPDLWRRAEPMTYLTPAAPPTLTLHGRYDTIVGFVQAERLDEAFRRLGARHYLIPIEAGHAFGYPFGTQRSFTLLPVMTAFLVRELERPGPPPAVDNAAFDLRPDSPAADGGPPAGAIPA